MWRSSSDTAARGAKPRCCLPVALVLALGLAGCGLTVTQDRPSYEELAPEEQGAVEIILQELSSFNDQVKARTQYDIGELLERDRIHVSFGGYIFTANLGDGVVHVSTWENLSSEQQALVQKWFGLADAAGTRDAYRAFFYRLMAVSQGAKQYMYNVLSPQWVYANRSLFNLERDTIRTAMSHFSAIGRRAEMWGLLERLCRPMVAQYDAVYGANFNKQYLLDHFQELARPTAPTGYMYFVCRWCQMGARDSENLTIELNWLRDLPRLD